MTSVTWTQGTVYTAGQAVEHNGKLYIKDNDTDQSAPDDVPGGWSEVPPERNNLAEFNAIATSFSSYEQRVKDHKAQVLAKLAAEGLSPDAVKAVLNA